MQGLGGKLVESSDGGTKFFVTNHLGTIAARMDLSGQTMEIYRYLPSGRRGGPVDRVPRNDCHTQACGALQSIGLECPPVFGDGRISWDDCLHDDSPREIMAKITTCSISLKD